MKHISLFSGIGGFDLASEWMGWQNVASCEINPFGNKVLQYYWPNAYHHDDIKTLTYEKLNQELTRRFGADWRSDDIILTGGFPCQPYSAAGKRLGKEDERHLWPEMLRVIREVKPTYVVGENVLGLVNWSGGLVFEEVQVDLEAQGYEVQPFVLPACAVNAPHRRDRVWFVAYSDRNGRRCVCRQQSEQPFKTYTEYSKSCSKWIAHDTDNIRYDQRECDNEEFASEGRVNELNEFNENVEQKTASNSVRERLQRSVSTREHDCQQWNGQERKVKQLVYPFKPRIQFENFPTQSPICTGDDGISTKLDGITFPKWRNESIKAAGNAILPQLVYLIFKAIEQYEQNRNNGEDRKAAD